MKFEQRQLTVEEINLCHIYTLLHHREKNLVARDLIANLLVQCTSRLNLQFNIAIHYLRYLCTYTFNLKFLFMIFGKFI